MKIWFRRILALALISLGIALAFLPFNDTRSGSVETEVVYLQKEKLLDPEVVHAQYPGEEISDITGPEFNPDDYPELWSVIIDLDAEWNNNSCEIDEWNVFENSFFKEKKEFRLMVFRDGLISCSTASNNAESVKVGFSFIGRYNSHIKELSESDLKKYSSITKAIENINFGKESFSDLTPIPKTEWDKMVTKYLNPIEDLQTFKFEGIYYGPEFELDTIWKEGTVANLKLILKAIGVILFLIGFSLIRRLYNRKRGIMINPPKVAVLFDVIVLLFAIPSAYMVANLVLSKTLFITPITSEEFILLMGTFFFCLGIPFVTLYTSRFTSQSVLFSAEGIFVDNLVSKDFMAWESLDSIEFSNEYVMVSRVGMPLPKHVQKCLRLIGKEGQRIIINEPQLKSVKKKVIAKFEEFLPDHLKEKILQMLVKW